MTEVLAGRAEQSPAPVRLHDMRNLYAAARAIAEVRGKRRGLAGAALAAYVGAHWAAAVPEAKAAVAQVRGAPVLRSPALLEAVEDVASLAKQLHDVSGA